MIMANATLVHGFSAIRCASSRIRWPGEPALFELSPISAPPRRASTAYAAPLNAPTLSRAFILRRAPGPRAASLEPSIPSRTAPGCSWRLVVALRMTAPFIAEHATGLRDAPGMVAARESMGEFRNGIG